VRVLQRPPGFAVALGVVAAAEVIPRLRAVDEHEVDVVQAELLQGSVDGGGRAVVVLDLVASLGETNSSSRGTPEVRTPSPTPRSLP
jgi:hypothetical protein